MGSRNHAIFRFLLVKNLPLYTLVKKKTYLFFVSGTVSSQFYSSFVLRLDKKGSIGWVQTISSENNEQCKAKENVLHFFFLNIKTLFPDLKSTIFSFFFVFCFLPIYSL